MNPTPKRGRGEPRAGGGTRGTSGPARDPRAAPIGAENEADEAGQDAPALPPARPFQPRRGLFYFLCLMMALWIAGLLAMYFTTVYPYTHAPSAAPRATP